MILNFYLLQICTKCTFTTAWLTSANESSAGDISMTDWTTADIPPLNGKTAVITGATGGLGYETALALAGAGANVVLTGRNDAKGRNAVQGIRGRFPDAKVSYEALDLASLASVAEFAARFVAAYPPLDLLINNAGVMALPQRQTTVDGFEMQFGTNYLGHYALTARLLPSLRRGHQPRVVNLSSPAHRGYARTDLIANGPGAIGLLWQLNKSLQPFVSHSAAEGALPTLFAATSPRAEPGGYYGPNWFYELKGPPVPAKIMPRAKDPAVAARLWDVSVALTGVSFDQFAAAA